MSEPKPEKKESPFNNPTVLAALITSFMGLMGILITQLPNLLPKDSTTATPLVVVVATAVASATSVPPTATTELVAATSVPLTNTAIPATLPTTPPPTAAQAQPPNVLLMYDNESFTLLNQSTGVLSLEGVVFRSSAGAWDAVRWGASLYNSLPNGRCLRLRDFSVGQRQPPPPCVNQIYGLIEVQGSDLFWLNVDTFEVVRSGAVLATCTTSADSCAVYIAQ
jgi:hypothetical protein